MQASQRLDRFGAEVFASLNNKLLALKAQGKTIYNMSVGTPDFKPYDHVVEALTQAAQNPEMWKYSLRYLPELKQAVCDYYERRFGVSGITPSMVQSCNGTQEGVGHLGLALLDPGDTILVPDPCYPVFEAGAKIADAKLEYYPLVAEHNYLPYVAGIDPEVADRAKYMIVSLPANPVGSVGTPEVYEEIIAFAREHDLLIVHDNAYSDIVFDGEPGGRTGEGALSVSVGLTYKFAPRGWGRGKTLERTIYNNDAINEMRRQLDAATAENERLKAALAKGDTKAGEASVKQIAAANLVVFQINESKLSNEGRVNLGILAEVMKQGDPNMVYTVTGYADRGTGDAATNERLSRERAEAVYECLTKEFGVPAKMLRIDYKGGVENMYYDDPRLSRAVITKGE